MRISRTGLLSGLAVFGVLSSVSGALLAQSMAPRGVDRVAVVDVVRVFNEYQRQRDLAEEMRKEEDTLQQENERRRRQLDMLQATLDAMDPNDPAYEKKLRERFERQIDYKNWFDLKQADRVREVGLWTCRIYKEIIDSVGRVSDGQKIGMVMYIDPFECGSFDPEQIRNQIRARRVVWASQQADLTDLVLEDLNTRYRAEPRQKMLSIP